MKLKIIIRVCLILLFFVSRLPALESSTATAAAPGSIDLFPIKENGKWGYINRAGEIVIEPQFLDVTKRNYEFNPAWSEERAPVRFAGGLWGFIDKTGKAVITPQFQQAERFSDGLARVMQNGLMGYVNKNGEMVIPPRYCYTGEFGDFKEGLAYVQIIPGCFTISHDPVDRRTEYGYIDKTGKMVLPNLGSGWFAEGLAPVYVNGKPGYIDRRGETVIEGNFKTAQSFENGLAHVMTDKKTVYLDKTGRIVIDAPRGFYITCCNYAEGMTTVISKNHKYGYIDKNSKIVIQPQFDGAEEFSEGLAAVNRGADKTYTGGKWGFIDKTGKLVIDFQFDHVEAFHNGLALVGDAFLGEIGYIDKTGKYIWKPAK